MIDRNLFVRVAERIERYEEEMIRLQMQLTAIPAIAPESGGDGEAKKAQYLKNFLEESGFRDIVQIDAPDSRTTSGRRPSLIVRCTGREKRSTVWIMSHLDIVPPGEASLWSSDPYKAYVKDGKIYGRGVDDNQQDLCASIFAAKACLDEGIALPNPIGLLLVADEETASQFGISYVLSHPENPFKKTDIIVVPDSGNPEGSLIEIAEKSILWLCFRTIGRQTHGSRPASGKNAFLAASTLIVRLHELLHTRFPLSDPLFQPPQSTFEPTKKEGNVPNINTIPARMSYTWIAGSCPDTIWGRCRLSSGQRPML